MHYGEGIIWLVVLKTCMDFLVKTSSAAQGISMSKPISNSWNHHERSHDFPDLSKERDNQ